MLTEHDTGDSAVSPVVAVILLVAVTVALSAVIGTFALELGQQSTDGQSQQSLGIKTAETDSGVTASVITGSGDELKVLVDGEEVKNISDPSAGDSVQVSASKGQSVTIISVTDGSSSVVSSTTVSSSTSSVVGPEEGLVVHYKFEEGSGSTLFDTTSGYDGTIQGASWATVDGSTALSFDGVDDNVTATDADAVNPTNITVSAWVYLENSSKNWMAVDKGSSQAGTFYLYDHENHGLRWVVKDKSGTQYGVEHTSKDLSNYTWHHIVGTYNDSGGVIRLYVNGQEVNNVTGTKHAGSNSKPLRLGNFEGGGYHLNGSLRDVRIYNQTLSKQEVSDLYNATK